MNDVVAVIVVDDMLSLDDLFLWSYAEATIWQNVNTDFWLLFDISTTFCWSIHAIPS